MARPFVWTPAKEQAAQLEGEGKLTQAEIAEQLGVSRRTIEGWVRRTAFRARLRELNADSRDNILAQLQARYAARIAPPRRIVTRANDLQEQQTTMPSPR